MKRFFNYGQEMAAPVKVSSKIKFYEKLDGTLCILYWDSELQKACVGTRSMPDADIPINGFVNQTFSNLFWKTYNNTCARSGKITSFWNLPELRRYTYCFEFCIPENQVVVRYNDYTVYLIFVRDNVDGKEYDPTQFASVLVGVQ